MTRDAKQRAGPIVHKNEVRDVDGKAPRRIQWVHDLERRPVALLLRSFDLSEAGPAALALSDELGRLRVGLANRLRERMPGSDGDET